MGANADFVLIDAGETHRVPPLSGPGIIRHIWLTMNGESSDFYRELQFVLRFDNAPTPQIDIPLADFFLFGHGLLVDVNAAPIQVSKQPHITEKPYRGGLNCLFPMPFAENAAIEIRNTGDTPVIFFYYIDWEAYETFSDPLLHFHATLNEEHTTAPAGQTPQPHGKGDGSIVNKGWKENYTLLEIDGFEGHYVGTGLNVECKPGDAGKWWEGDDMFVIDGEPWPPRLHGTGTEDYFNLAWGFRQVECRPEYGVTYLDKNEADSDQTDGRFTVYRFHLNDPITFEKSLHASIEHGHANDCETYYRSVAYWYGRNLS